MAVVGEAHIIVRAITTTVKDDIRRGFSGVGDIVSKAGKDISRSFKTDFAREAEAARKAWQRLTKTGFVLQTALGVVAGGIGSLALSIGGLVGAVGGAAASLASLSGIIASFPAAIATAKLAFSGIGQALSAANRTGGGYQKTLKEINEELQQLAFDQEEAALSVERAGINLERARENLLRVQDLPTNSRARREAELEAREAELAYRRALDAKNDLDDLAKDPFAATSRGGTDPFAGLLPSQAAFAKYLLSLKPLLTDLKAASANSFLPVLQVQIDRLVKGGEGVTTLFDVVEKGLETISGSLGSSVTNFFDSLTDPSALQRLDTVFENSGVSIEKYGKILGSVYEAFLTITTGSNETTQRFLDFLDSRAASFKNFLDTEEASGRLQVFFQTAGNFAADLGAIFGNIFRFVGDLIADTFNPNGVSSGAYLITWLKRVTQGWKDFREEIGKSEFNSQLLQGAVNAKAILQAFKPLVVAVGRLGADENVRKTFDALAVGGDALGQILEAGLDAGPVFGELLANLTEFVATVADADAIKTFFGVLSDAARALSDIMKNEVIKDFVNTIGQVVAFMLAIQTLKAVGVFAFKVLAGALIPIQTGLVAAGTSATVLQTALTRIGFLLKGVGIAGLTLFGVAAAGRAIKDSIVESNQELLGAQDVLLNIGSAASRSGKELLDAALGGLDGVLQVSVSRSGRSLREVGEAVDTVSISTRELTKDSSKLRLLLDGLNNTVDDGVNIFSDFNDTTRISTEEAFKNIGTALATISRTNLPLAITKFKEFRDGKELTSDQAETFYNLMGTDFSDAIREAATAVGIYVTDQDVMNIAMGRGRIGSELLAKGLGGINQSAEEAKASVQLLEQALYNFGREELDLRQVNRAFEASIDDIEESLKRNGKTLDDGTDKGRANNDALESLIEAGLRRIAINDKMGASDEALNDLFDDLKTKVEEAAIAFGSGATEAQLLADTLVGEDFEISITLATLTEAQLQEVITDTREKLKLPENAVIVQSDIDRVADPNFDPDAVYVQDPRFARRRRKDGGIVRSFSLGGMVYGAGGPRSDSIPAMLSNGEFVINAASTEKYLPLLKALNSEGIGGARLANGGMPGATINMTVNAAPGMNTSEIVNEVSRRIAFELRSGVA
jgi:hypothetical protein